MLAIQRHAASVLLFLATVTAGLVPVFAAETLSLPYKPALGSRWTIISESREVKKIGDRIVATGLIRQNAEYKIESKISSGYRVVYTLRDKVAEGDTRLARLVGSLVEPMKGVSLIIDTDKNGVPVRVVNVEEIKKIAVDDVDAILRSKPDWSAIPAMARFIAMQRARLQALTPEEGVEHFGAGEPDFFRGVDLSVGDERSYVAEDISSMTGTRRHAKGHYKLASVDRQAGLATIEQDQTVDPEDVRRTVVDLIKRVEPNDPEQMKRFEMALARTAFDITDHASYQIALADGVIRRMEHITAVKLKGVEVLKTEIMTMQPAQ